MTEASEESKRNRPYFRHIISEHLAIEKTICNRKSPKHGVVMCIIKKLCMFFTGRGHIDPPGWIGLKYLS